MTPIDSDVKLLGRMANMALSCLTQEEAVAVAARFLPQLFPGETGALYLRNPGRDLYEPVTSWGEDGDWKSFPGQDCWSLRRRRIYVVGGDREQPPCPHSGHDPGRWISLCVPMTVWEDAPGVLHLLVPTGGGKEGRDSAEALAALRRLAALAADVLTLLLVNLRLRRQIDDLSARDAQTGCFNQRYLDETLARELKVSERTGRPLALVLMDIDHFGLFTEAYGHGASALVLRNVGNFLREHLREVDIPSRYGADEFALLFPDTTLETAVRRAENLHSMMKDRSQKDGHGHMRRVTLSMGIAAYPDQGETLCDLVEAAKKALRKAKETGRDRIVSGNL